MPGFYPTFLNKKPMGLPKKPEYHRIPSGRMNALNSLRKNRVKGNHSVIILTYKYEESRYFCLTPENRMCLQMG